MSAAAEYQDWRCANCGNQPPFVEESEPGYPCGWCGNDKWYLRTVEPRFAIDAEPCSSGGDG